MSISSIPGVSPRMLHSLLVSYFEQPVLPNGRVRLCPYVTGIPGVGKTAIVHQAADAAHLPCLDLRLIQHETVDVVGAIAVDAATHTADWYPFEAMFPTDPDWQGVIFIDEIGQLDVSMQKIVMSIKDKAGVAGRRIPAGARIVLAGNRQQDRAGSTRVLSTIESRSLSVELLFSMSDFQAWCAANGIDQIVRSYATFVGANEFVPEFKPAEQIHAVPRTWAAVSDELQARPGADPSAENAEIRTVIQSLVGPGPVSQFMAFRQHFHLLHNVVEKVFDAPLLVDMDSLESSAMHALIGAVAGRMKERNGTLTASQADNVGVFLHRLPSRSFQTLMVLHCDRAGSQQWKGNSRRGQWVLDNEEAIRAAMGV